MKSDSPFVVATLTFLTLGMVLLLAFNWRHVPDQWQSYICKPEDCTLQQWLSSVAGWFGGFLAAVGAVVIYWQLREQRRQTEFLIGDGEPTVDVVCTAWDELSASFRVVNWNRRLIVISSIRFHPDPGVKPTLLHSLRNDYDWDNDGKPDTFITTSKIKANGEFSSKPDIAGWEDRSKPPAAKIFVLAFDENVKPEAFGTEARKTITVSFEIFTPGNHVSTRDISVKTARGNLFARTQAMHDEYSTPQM